MGKQYKLAEAYWNALIYKIREINPTAKVEFLAKFPPQELEKYYNRLLSVKPFGRT